MPTASGRAFTQLCNAWTIDRRQTLCQRRTGWSGQFAPWNRARDGSETYLMRLSWMIVLHASRSFRK